MARARKPAGLACARCRAMAWQPNARECYNCIRARWAKEDGQKRRKKNVGSSSTDSLVRGSDPSTED